MLCDGACDRRTHARTHEAGRPSRSPSIYATRPSKACVVMESWASAVLSPSLRVANGLYGYAVHAGSDINPGTLLVRVPAALAVTAESALRVKAIAELVSRETEAHVTLAIWLMHTATASGAHGEYVRALTSADIDCTLQWSEVELGLLQLSRAGAKARALQSWARDHWAQLSARPAFAGSAIGNATLDQFSWALCAVWSRSFQMRCATEDCDGVAGTSGGVWRVMAPGADLLNHDAFNAAAVLELSADGARPELWHSSPSTGAGATNAEAAPADGLDEGVQAAEAHTEEVDAARVEAAASWEAASTSSPPDDHDLSSREAFMLRAARRIKAGEEVTLNYGSRANSELLTTHGFALLDNPAESTPLSLEPTAADPLGEIKRKLLAAGNVTSPFHLSATSLTTDSDLLVALRIGSANAVELRGQAYANAFKGLPLSERNERRWRGLLRERAGAMLAELESETTYSIDRAMLHQMGPPSRERSEIRKRAALITRMGEKQMLRAVLDRLDHMREAVPTPMLGTASATGQGA